MLNEPNPQKQLDEIDGKIKQLNEELTIHHLNNDKN
jgi:hypothetical protein